MMIYFMPRIGSYHSEMGADLHKKGDCGGQSYIL